MSTTVELLAANERYERLRAAVEELADEWDTWTNPGRDLYGDIYANDLRYAIKKATT